MKEMGHSERAACKRLEEQQGEHLGYVIYSKEQIRDRYRYYVGERPAEFPPPAPEIIEEIDLDFIEHTAGHQVGRVPQ